MLPTDAKARKDVPIFSGVLAYFPDAIAAVAEVSKKGNDQHNPGEPLHWARAKSGDELDALTRHLLEAGTIDDDGVRHSTKLAWRALANLQKELERELGLPISRGSRATESASPALDDGATQLDGLTCKASGDRILIAISATALKAATDNHPEFWDGETDKNTVAVIDPQEWLKSVVRHITDESEDGSSLLTDMFDAAIKAAVENGEEGCGQDDRDPCPACTDLRRLLGEGEP